MNPWSDFWVLYLDFEGAKNIYVLNVPILGFWGCWHLNLGLDMVTGLLYTLTLNFGSLS